MQESNLIIDTMESYLTSNGRKIFILLISIWMMSWLLCGTIVNAIIIGQVRSPLIIIQNDLGDDIHVLCTGWPQARGPDNRVIHETIAHRSIWHIGYGQDILQERLFCEVKNYKRSWNCFLVNAIPYMCMWENTQRAVARASMPSPGMQILCSHMVLVLIACYAC